MTRRLLLAGFAVAVAGALVFLIISAKTSSSNDTSSAGDQSDGSGLVSEAQAAEPPPAPRARRMKGDPQPEPEPSEVGLVAETAHYRDYVRPDGTRTRDHRERDVPPPDLTRAREVAKERAKVDPKVILAVRGWLRPRVFKCSQDYQRDIGTDAKVDVRLKVSITDGVVSVIETAIHPKNVSGGDMVACIEQAVVNMALETDQAEDVAHHMLTFPFVLPMK